jgi:hypothetical protein
VTGQTTVMVTPSVNKSHDAAAHTVLTTPDTLPVLVLGGDHLKGGISAVQQALDDETLRPHYACVEVAGWLKDSLVGVLMLRRRRSWCLVGRLS